MREGDEELVMVAETDVESDTDRRTLLLLLLSEFFKYLKKKKCKKKRNFLGSKERPHENTRERVINYGIAHFPSDGFNSFSVFTRVRYHSLSLAF